MSRINVGRLTADEDALCLANRDEWLASMLSTAPAERAAAEDAVDRAFFAEGYKAPRHKLWVDSPHEGYLLASRFEREVPGLNRIAWTHSSIAHYRAKKFDDYVRALIVTYDLGDKHQLRWLARAGASTARVVDSAVHAKTGWINETVRDAGLPPGSSQFAIRDLAKFDVLGKLGVDVGPVAPLIDLAKLCGFWWACGGGVVILCERPAVIRTRPAELDAGQFERHARAGELHNESGPALVYRDGFEAFALDGVRVHPRVVRSPADIEVHDILNERDVRSRRKLLERCDLTRLAKSLAVTHHPLHRDDFGTLHRIDMRDDEPLSVVLVKDPGTQREYGLRVPPTIKTAKAAVAWTFGFHAETYRLTAEA